MLPRRASPRTPPGSPGPRCGLVALTLLAIAEPLVFYASEVLRPLMPRIAERWEGATGSSRSRTRPASSPTTRGASGWERSRASSRSSAPRASRRSRASAP